MLAYPSASGPASDPVGADPDGEPGAVVGSAQSLGEAVMGSHMLVMLTVSPAIVAAFARELARFAASFFCL